MGYALRHVSDLFAAFREYHRVLRPGGRVLILEISRPASRLGLALARLYLKRLVPLVTRVGTGSADAQRLTPKMPRDYEPAAPAYGSTSGSTTTHHSSPTPKPSHKPTHSPSPSPSPTGH